MKLFIAACLLACVPMLAQEAKDVRKHWNTSKEFTLAVANAMPDADYSFKAAAPEMSFGEMVVHIAQANGSYCGRATGKKSPIGNAAGMDKASATKLLEESFDFCAEAISALNGADFDKMMGPAGRQSSTRELLWAGFTHVAHHRAQLEVYLRLKGIKPPDYQF